MKKDNSSAKLTLWVGRGVAVVLVALMFLLPAILDWFSAFRHLEHWQRILVIVSFCCCVAFIGWALWNMDRMLRNVIAGEVFVRKNVCAVRQVRWCCGVVSLICAVAALAYLPLVALAVIMAFLCLTVSVVVQVMDAAVTIREENDLTI